MTRAATCHLTVVRGSAYADYVRSYKMLVNGKVVGSIARNSKLELLVPSGPVTVEARIDWGRSAPLTIDAKPDVPIEVEVSNNWGATRSLWGITFGYRSYLLLKRAPAA